MEGNTGATPPVNTQEREHALQDDDVGEVDHAGARGNGAGPSGIGRATRHQLVPSGSGVSGEAAPSTYSHPSNEFKAARDRKFTVASFKKAIEDVFYNNTYQGCHLLNSTKALIGAYVGQLCLKEGPRDPTPTTIINKLGNSIGDIEEDWKIMVLEVMRKVGDVKACRSHPWIALDTKKTELGVPKNSSEFVKVSGWGGGGGGPLKNLEDVFTLGVDEERIV